MVMSTLCYLQEKTGVVSFHYNSYAEENHSAHCLLVLVSPGSKQEPFQDVGYLDTKQKVEHPLYTTIPL